MTYQSSNNNTIYIVNDKVYINGVSYKIPGHGQTVIQTNDHIYINGYEFKNGKFKRSLRAFFNCLF